MPLAQLSWPYGCKHIAMIAGSWAKWVPQVLMPVQVSQLVEPATGRTELIEVWTTEINLPDNIDAIYRYKFIVDGEWMYDAAQPALPNPTGSWDNYVKVRNRIVCIVRAWPSDHII
jgi:hypothetical protein